MKYLLALDLETTGLDPEFHEIIQIGAILLNKNLATLGEFSTLVKPKHFNRGIQNKNSDDRDFNVYEFTGISIESLKEAPSLSNSINNLFKFIKKHTKIETLKNLKHITLFGQNPQFDYKFLYKAFQDLDKPFTFDYHVIGLDSIWVAYNLIKEDKLPNKIGLHSICKELNIINPHEHNALMDIKTTVEAFKVMTSILKVGNVG